MNRSESINELVAALAKAQSEFDKALKDTDNPFFRSKYADLATIINATRPHLNKNGLTVTQGLSCNVETSTVAIETMLAHSSGQWISEILHLPGNQKDKFDSQSVGSAFTYGRRYGWQSITGICADADDDGNAAAGIGGSKEDAKRLQSKKVANEAAIKKGPESVALTEWKEGLIAISGNGLQILKAEVDIGILKEIGFKMDGNVVTIPSANTFKFEDLCKNANIPVHWAKSAQSAVK